MQVAYYPGCTLAGSGLEYGMSLRQVAPRLGLELTELDGWSCCGATSGQAVDEDLALALPARNLALAQAQQPDHDLLAPCAACYARLKQADYCLREQPEQAARVKALVGLPLAEGGGAVLSILDLLSQPELEQRLGEAVQNSLGGLRVACYYGCLYLRPAAVTGSREVENPQTMERLLRLCGAEPVAWSFKNECCGASHQVSLPRESRPLLHNIYRNARANGAEAIVTACPLCQMNLDMREQEINKAWQEDFDLPIFYLTELLGLALAIPAKKLGLHKHCQPTKPLLQTIAQRAAREVGA